MNANGKIGGNGVQVSDNVEKRFETDIYIYIYIYEKCLKQKRARGRPKKLNGRYKEGHERKKPK